MVGVFGEVVKGVEVGPVAATLFETNLLLGLSRTPAELVSLFKSH